MSTIGVKISGNKTFANAAEQLLTRKTQYIHTLLTDLSSFANEHCEKLKSAADRKRIVHQYESLCRAVITGYRAGVAGTEPPNAATAIADCEERVKYLSGPFAVLGYKTACLQIELLLEKGWHRSQTNKPPSPPEQHSDQNAT